MALIMAHGVMEKEPRKLEVRDYHDGPYEAQLVPEQAGKHEVHVILGGKHVEGSPVQIDVEFGDASAKKGTARGREELVVGEEGMPEVIATESGVLSVKASWRGSGASKLLKRWRIHMEKRKGLKVDRAQLIDRLQVELDLVRGLRTLLIALLTFTVIRWLALPRTGGVVAGTQAEFGLLTTYTDMLGLDQVKEVYSAPELRDFMLDLSARSRTMLPLSDVYFKEEQGDKRVVAGTRNFRRTELLSTLVVNPRIDSASFTLTAWVQEQRV